MSAPRPPSHRSLPITRVGSPRLSPADFLQRGAAWACIGLTGYAGILLVHGLVVRAQRRRGALDEVRDRTASMIERPTEQAAGSLDNPKISPSTVLAGQSECISLYFSSQLLKSFSHGIYGVSVDQAQITYYSGYSATDQFQQVLYATSGLSEGDHQIKISNENSRNIQQYPNYTFLDIDFAAFTGTILDATAPVITTSSSSLIAISATTTVTISSSSSPSSSPSSSLSSSIAASISITTNKSSSTPSSSSTSTTSTTSTTSQLPIEQFSSQVSPFVSTTLTLVSASSSVTTLTTGTPNIPNIPSSSSLPGSDSSSSTSHKTTAVAVSVTVIVIAAAVIATILGLIWWNKRRMAREDEDEEHNLNDPESSWR
ncbi:MAG: hypothetical protein TREMPRED_001594 [Tremellales sp. Tagirdzhanova-0007]|nr:MAG: hypothetical protein TREMPRED_001594 [Tremellales sp. Tagirdzhanova-0007]